MPASWSQVVMRVRMCFPWVGLRKRNMEAVEGLRSYVAVLPLPAMVSVCTLEVDIMRMDYIFTSLTRGCLPHWLLSANRRW